MRMQTVGFLLTAVFYFACSGVEATATPATLQVLYLLSSFFVQFPNCTTFLVPAEIFPTEVRTIAHGISAASGKLGALVVTLIFAFGVGSGGDGDSLVFLVSGIVAAIGFVITLVFIPNEDNIDLDELDKKFQAQIDGKPEEYTGPATETSSLSYFEILICCAHQKNNSNQT
jgi:nitrate/nitrite transporter NarK